MSDIPISRAQLQCIICERLPFSRATLRRHQLTTHDGDSSPAAPIFAAALLPVPDDGVRASSSGPVALSSAQSLGQGDGGQPDRGAAQHEHDAENASLLQATTEARPHRPRGRKRPRPTGVSDKQESTTHPSIATRVCAVYEDYGDTGRSTRLIKPRAHIKAGQFNSRRLRAFQSFAFKAGGCGLSAGDTKELWNLILEWESDTPPAEGRPKRLRDYFPTPHAMRQALAADIDEAVDNDAWYACKLTHLNDTCEAYYRDALPGLLETLSSAPKVRYWAKGDENDGPFDCRETPFDCDAFRMCEEQVLRDHGPNAFVLAIHAYSDSCFIYSSTGTLYYGVCVSQWWSACLEKHALIYCA